MKAIIVKYLDPTNTKPARWKASDGDGNNITVSHERSSSEMGSAAVAAFKLCKIMGWNGTLKGGSLKNSYVFVFDNPEHTWIC